MKLVHEVFDWKGIPILAGLFIFLFLVENKFELRKRVQQKKKRAMINSLVSIPSFVLLRFLLIPVMVWLALQNERLHHLFIFHHVFSLGIAVFFILAKQFIFP